MLSIALGGVVLFGWWANIESLRSIIPGSTPLKPNIAAGFLLCGAVLVSLAGKKLTKPIGVFATVLAITVIALGGLTLVEHFFNWNLGIDTWLVRKFPAVMGSSHPGRMLPATAFCFV
ncbi:MAG: PAS domain-containing sensor histidine kinase, partial [Verrucomicrobia bacterium]